TLLISAVGLVPDLSRAISSGGMDPGDDLWLIGTHAPGLAGSVADVVFSLDASTVPDMVADPLPRYRAVHRAISRGLVTAAHDCSDGGVVVALAEMAIAARFGIEVDLPTDDLDPFIALVNEAPGRLILASDASVRDEVAGLLGEHSRRIGRVTSGDRLIVAADSEPIEIPLEAAVNAFRVQR
ncbi:MAG: AIR synthase-related protein, partial [Acidimicrobiales bacterium]